MKRFTGMVGTSGAFALAAAAFAQPTPNVDMGTLVSGVAQTDTHNYITNEVRWIKFTIPAAADAGSNTYLDVSGGQAAAAPFYPNNDIDINLFDNSGNFIVYDDLDGQVWAPSVTFGATVPTRPNIGTGAPHDGRDGTLPAGTYYMALAGYEAIGAAPWSVTSDSVDSGNVTISVKFGSVSAPTAPTVFTDLGTPALGTSGQSCVTLAAAEVEWFKVVLPAVADPTSYFDVFTSVPLTGALTNQDTEIGIYDNTGVMIATDDDDDRDFLSAFSFGTALPNRAAHGNGTAFDGRDGSLAGGTYWISLSAFDSAFGLSGWSVSSTSADTGGVCLNWGLNAEAGPASTNPDAIVDITPLQIAGCGGTAVITAEVIPGTNPASTGIDVTVDTTSIGGVAGIVLHDDGNAPDVTAADGIYSANIIAGLALDGLFALPVTVADDQARSVTGNVLVGIDSIGDLPATARGGDGTNIAEGAAGVGDIDLRAICVTNPAGFEATVIGGAAFDTQMFLFNSSGVGIVMNDDGSGSTFQSRIFGFPLASGGLHFLSIGDWQHDPLNAATNAIWEPSAAPYTTMRAPDGALAAGDFTLASWNATVDNGGDYQITLTGAVFSCPADLADISGAGRPDCGVDINDLLYFLAQFEAGSPGADLSNISGTGVPDCGVDINDLLFFLAHFEGGC